jgi:hypothetical protein
VSQVTLRKRDYASYARSTRPLTSAIIDRGNIPGRRMIMSRTDEGKYEPVERGNGVQFIGVFCPQ